MLCNLTVYFILPFSILVHKYCNYFSHSSKKPVKCVICIHVYKKNVKKKNVYITSFLFLFISFLLQYIFIYYNTCDVM